MDIPSYLRLFVFFSKPSSKLTLSKPKCTATASMSFKHTKIYCNLHMYSVPEYYWGVTGISVVQWRIERGRGQNHPVKGCISLYSAPLISTGVSLRPPKIQIFAPPPTPVPQLRTPSALSGTATAVLNNDWEKQQLNCS